MRMHLVFAVVLMAGSAWAGEPPKSADLAAALAQAKTEDKLLFVQYGREACGNCQALKGMIRSKQVKLSEKDFVYADLNCDDAATSLAFRQSFKVEGNMLPFVVIADPDGKQLASRAGYGDAETFKEFVKDARRDHDKARKALAEPKKLLRLPTSSLADAGIAKAEDREVRVWTASSGDQVTARLIELREGMVHLQKDDGNPLRIRPHSLSKGDQDYLAELRKPVAAQGK